MIYSFSPGEQVTSCVFFSFYLLKWKYAAQIIGRLLADGEKLTISCFAGDAKGIQKTWPLY